MSLFKTKDWWRTECGDLRECFDGQSLLVARHLLDKAEPRDAIVVASHAGLLRIYAPANHWDDELKAPGPYKSTDLAVEAKLADAILDVKAGKFIAGSQDERLAILTPTKLIIYTVTLTKGSTEHGDRCQLQAAYEHQLKRFPFSLTVGPFGGARGRDFLCVQCLDGTLMFYEQEVFAFSRSLKTRLLPEPLIYVPRNDVFVTLNSGWVLECYRYQNIAEIGRKEDAEESDTRKGIIPDWSYNIGEPIIDINSVTLTSFETGIVVLGERTLYCLGDSCTSVKTAKRLEYSPLCFLAYVIEPDGKLMTMVVADTSTLMIYEGTTLKWSAQLPFAPVAVARANLQNLEGAIVILSEDGRLEVCYLGSEPSLFIAPPINRRGFDYVAAENELLELRKLRKKSSSTDAQVTNATVEAELTISAQVSPELLPAPRTDKDEKDNQQQPANQSSMCKIELEFSTYTLIRDLQVFVEADKPLVVINDTFDLPNLCEKYNFVTYVHLKGIEAPTNPEVCVYATYENEKGELRVIDKSIQVPLKLLLRPCPAETSAPFSLTIKSTEPILNFSQIFPEFVGELQSRQITNSLGLQHSQSDQVVTLLAAQGAMQNRYRLQSSDNLAVPLVFQQLISRLNDKAPGTLGKLNCALGQQHIQLVQSKIDAHFDARLRFRAALKEIGLLTTQLRNIEKRMLRGMRERNSRSLAATGLPALLESTYRAIFALLDELQAARAEQEKAAYELQSSLKLVLQVLKLSLPEDTYRLAEAALSFEPQHRDDLDWEEVTDMSLIVLNRALSNKQQQQQQAVGADFARQHTSYNRFESTRDLAKLKKRLSHALEKLAASGSSGGAGTSVIRESPAEELGAGNLVS